jgi:ferrous iron transport protein A
MMALAQLQPKQTAKVLGFAKACPAGYKRRLLSMGVLPNTVLTVLRVAPLGDPIELRLRDFHLTLRKAEAAAVLVEVLS